MEFVLEILTDALIDTIKLVPFLFVTYLVMEAIEQKSSSKAEAAVQQAGFAGPIVGALVGAFPQCGFSAAASTLYAAKVITVGTLIAVYLATSDEMLPIFIAEQADPMLIAKILGIKIIIGMLMGFIIDAFVRITSRGKEKHLHICDLCEKDHCGCNHEHHHCDHAHELSMAVETGTLELEESVESCDLEDNHECNHEHCQDGEHECAHDHDYNHDHNHNGGIVRSAGVHTIQVTLFIFIITLILDAVIGLIGEDALGEFLSAQPAISVFASSFVGLIPNCAASVVITELFLQGTISTGSMIAGLLVAAGVGLLVLFRSNRPMKNNIGILITLFLIGVFWGSLIDILGFIL